MREILKIYHILIFALILRLIMAFVIILPLAPDSGHYHQIAKDLISGKGYGDLITRPPGYSTFLSLIYLIFGEDFTAVRIIQVILSTFTVYITFLLTKQMFSEEIAIYAGMICAIDPFQIYFSGMILSETLFIFLFFLFIYLFEKTFRSKNFILAIITGIILGASNLTRAVGQGILFVFIISGIIASKFRSFGDYIKLVLIFVFMSLTMLPWMLRNYFVFGKFIPVSVQKGWNMYEGLNPDFRPEARQPWIDKFSEETKHMDTFEADDYLWKKSINWIKSHPKEFIVLSIRKFFKYWRLYPYTPCYSIKEQIISIVFFLPLILLTIIGIFISIRNWREIIFIFMPLIYFSILHSIFACQIRYRIPLHPILAIFAGVGLDMLYNKFKGKNV